MLAGVRRSSTQTATYAVTINPLVELDLVRLRRDGARHRARAAAGARVRVRRREGAGRRRRRRRCWCLLVLLPAASLRAQTQRDGRRPRRAASCERQLEGEIICTCGCRAAAGQLPHAATVTGTRAQTREDRSSTSRRARTTSRSSRPSSQEYGSQDIAGGADRQGLQPPRVAVPVPGRRVRRGDDRPSPRSSGRACRTRRRPVAAVDPREEAALASQGWTMSSATSIKRPRGVPLPSAGPSEAQR